jgi:hypothetical protein
MPSHTDDDKAMDIPAAPMLQKRITGFARHTNTASAREVFDPNTEKLQGGQDADAYNEMEFELADSVPVPKSRPFGRRMSSRRSLMASGYASSRKMLSRSSSGSSGVHSQGGPGGGLMSIQSLAQLQALADADDEYQDDMNKSINTMVHAAMKVDKIPNEDGSIEVAFNASMEPGHTSPRKKAPHSATLKRAPPAAAGSYNANANANQKMPPAAKHELKFAGNDSASSFTPESLPMPPAAKMKDNHEPKWVGNDSASSFSKEATAQASTRHLPTGPSKDDDDDDQKDEAGAATSERPGMGEKQPSWLVDAMGQMSPEDLKAFLSGDVATTSGGGGAAASSQTSASALDGFENAEVLEQYRYMAHHEARQRVKENLGYDPFERAEEEELNTKKSSGGSGSSRGGGGSRGGGTTNGGGITVKEMTVPPMSIPPAAPLVPLATRKGGNRNICLPKYALPVCRFLAPTATPRAVELVTGKAVTVKEDTSLEIVARCFGCNDHLQVPIQATLVNCPRCKTISPVTSMR